MKRFFLSLSVLALMVASCTNEDPLGSDSETQSAETRNARLTGIGQIDNLYAQMVNSNQYKVAKAARNAFVDKMNFVGAASHINTTSKMLSWIGLNLGSTDFTSLAQAQQELAYSQNLTQQCAATNSQLYQLIDQQPNPAAIWKTLVSDEPMSTNDDPCGCIQTFMDDLDDSQDLYSAAMQEAQNGYGTYAEAEHCYAALVLQDGANYGNCIDECDD